MVEVRKLRKKRRSKPGPKIPWWRLHLLKGDATLGPTILYLGFAGFSILGALTLAIKEYIERSYNFYEELPLGINFIQPLRQWVKFEAVFLYGVPWYNFSVQTLGFAAYFIRFHNREVFSAYACYSFAQYLFAIACCVWTGYKSLLIRGQIIKYPHRNKYFYFHLWREENNEPYIDYKAPVWMDSIHRKFECCGVYGYKDWSKIWINTTEVPESCCKVELKECGVFNKDPSWANDVLNPEGCSPKFYESIERFLLITACIYFAVALIYALNFLALFHLAIHEKWRYIVRMRGEDEDKLKRTKEGRETKYVTKASPRSKKVKKPASSSVASSRASSLHSNPDSGSLASNRDLGGPHGSTYFDE